MKRGLILAVGASLSAHAWAASREILIVQVAPKTPENAVSLPVASRIADEFDSSGLLVPIVWSLSDAIVRSASESGSIKFKEALTPREIQEVAAKLKVGYVLVFSAVKSGGSLVAHGELFRGSSGNSIWKDDKTLSVSVADKTDWDSAGLTLAHTWLQLISSGALKSSQVAKPIPSPDPLPGKVDPTLDAAPAPKAATYDETLLKRAMNAMAKGEFPEAIGLLREAVDQAPRDHRPRAALIQALLAANLIEDAAMEARRGLRLTSEPIELRLLAARAWLRLGNIDEAQVDLQEAIAHDPTNSSTLVLSGDILVAKFHPEDAIESYSKALTVIERYDARVGRALAYAITGKLEESIADLRTLDKGSEGEVADSYSRMMTLLAPIVRDVVDELRLTLQLGATQPGSANSLEKGRHASQVATAISTFLSGLPCPPGHLESQQRRDLAYKLLAQAASDALEFAQKGNADVGEDARLNLGEATKALAEAVKAYELESRRP